MSVLLKDVPSKMKNSFQRNMQSSLGENFSLSCASGVEQVFVQERTRQSWNEL